MRISSWLDRFDSLAAALQAPLLLLLRLYWGWAFVQTGWGKLMHLERTAEYFGSLGLPAPQWNAVAAALTEGIGGLLLVLGLLARPAGAALAFTMAVAYATAHREELAALFSAPDEFTAADPFLFLLVALLVLAFGPGKWSVDHLRGRRGGAVRAQAGSSAGEPGLNSDSYA